MEALAYSEPKFDLVLILAALLLLLSVLRSVLDSWLYAGLIGQLALGALLGTPLAGIIPLDIEYTIQVLGYLGLLLLVAEGGMETRLDVLGTPFNLSLAILVGLTGIAAPIGLSMALLPTAFGYELLESFALGAALASTSLGTIFAVMGAVAPAKTSEEKPAGEAAQTASAEQQATLHGMGSTLVGTVLVGAALLDDIIGLVLSGVVKQLGTLSEGASPSPWSIAKPVVSSILLILVTALLARFALGPLARLSAGRLARVNLSAKMQTAADKYAKGTACFAFVAVLCAFVTISHEIGSTMLLGAFCAGALMTYVYHEFEVALAAASSGTAERERLQALSATFSPHSAFSMIAPVQTYVLAPFFFCSIGFAIPLRSMFTGIVAWRGFVYAGLMGAAKVFAGLWILPADALLEWRSGKRRVRAEAGDALELRNGQLAERVREEDAAALVLAEKKSLWQRAWKVAFLLGMSLVARGEIGFLIINVAREGGILAPDNSPTASQAFNVGTWAIVLNTLAGPIAVGILLSAKGVAEEIERGRWGFVGLRL